MAVVKTGISLDKDLLDRVTKIAQQTHTSRSAVFSAAVQDYLVRRENELIFEQLNKAYSRGPDPEDERMLEGMRRLYNRALDRDR